MLCKFDHNEVKMRLEQVYRWHRSMPFRRRPSLLVTHESACVLSLLVEMECAKNMVTVEHNAISGCF